MMFGIQRKKSTAYAVQPNVIKKSWTTANISSEVEDDTLDHSQEMSVFKSRDLIREYLLKTRVPEILKPHKNRRHSPTYDTSAWTSDINLAYKHPLVIAEELKNDAGEQLATFDNSSFIVPSAPRPIRHPKNNSSSDRPRLIGKVTPGIAKTWEQLTSAMDSSMESQAQEEDKQSYVLFVRKPFNFEPSEDFAVNKIQHDSSEKFFDSIDNDFQYAESCEDDEASGVEAGEMMAEGLDSLMRYNDVILWSIES